MGYVSSLLMKLSYFHKELFTSLGIQGLKSIYQKQQKNMSNTQYMYKLNNFRKEIRKQQIEQIFIEGRNKIYLTYQQTKTPEVSIQLANLYQNIFEAQQRQDYEDFIREKSVNYDVDWLYQFTSRDVSYEIQYKATSILSEYYYVNDIQIPSQSNLKCLIDCFRQSQNEILSNCTFILEIILENFRERKEILIQKFNIVELLIEKIQKCRNQQNLLLKILQILYRLLNLSKYHGSYSKLLYPMANFIMSLQDESTPFTKKINLTAIYNFHLLVRIFPEKDVMSREMVQKKIINKLIGICYKSDYGHNRLAFIVLDLIEICRENIEDEQIKQQIIYWMMEMRNINFEYENKSSIYTTQTIKTKVYSYLLYLTQTHSELASKIFLENNLSILRSFLQQLAQEKNPSLAELLAKILYCFSYWIKGQHGLNEYIRYQINRTLCLNNYRYELQIYFEGLQNPNNL